MDGMQKIISLWAKIQTKLFSMAFSSLQWLRHDVFFYKFSKQSLKAAI